MNFLFFNKIRRKLGLLCKEDWIWNFDINNKDFWKNIPKNNCEIYSSQDEVIFFKTKEKLFGGWYLFGIKHSGDNKFCFGSLSSGKNGINQSRPMFPIRRRWRVVRIKKNENIFLKLNYISDNLLINEIWLIPIFKFYAFLKIKNRIHTTLGIDFGSLNKMSRKNLWKEYNKILFSQKNKKRYLNYYLWQEQVEKKSLKKLILFKKKKKLKTKNFIINNDKKLSKVSQQSFVITTNGKDKLSDHAIDIFSIVLELNKDCLLLYPDEDCININGKRHSPNFKTAWNRELFFSNPSFSSCWVVKSELWNSAYKKLENNGIKITTFNLILEIIGNIESNNDTSKILHTPFICYHKISNKKNTHFINTSKSANYLENYINKYFFNIKEKVKIQPFNYGYNLTWSKPKNSLLSILIPTKDKVDLLRKCISSIEKNPAGISYEIIIIDNGSSLEETFDYLKSFIQKSNKEFPRKVLKIGGEFNYSLLNNLAVEQASGDVILLLNNDVEFISSNWGIELASNAEREGVGCVGAKLLFNDNTIQHGGVILGIGGVAGHSHKYLSNNCDGFQRRIHLQQEISAVTGACLAISKKNWCLLGGLDDKNLKVNYNDVDLCLKALNYGLKNIYMPKVVAYHFESKTRGKPIGLEYKKWKKEYKFMLNKWKNLLINDPFYNPNLSLMEEDFSIHLRRLNVISRSFDEYLLFEEVNI